MNIYFFYFVVTTSEMAAAHKRAASCGASEAPPHENGTMLADPFPKLNTQARCPSRSKLRGIHFKINGWNY
jgi:hypothetical protein